VAPCLDSDALLAWAAGKLTDAQREQALVHLDECSTCRQALSALARIEPTVHREPVVPLPRRERAAWRTWLIIGLAALGGVAATLVIATRLAKKAPETKPATPSPVATPIAEPKPSMPEPSPPPAATPAPRPAVEARPAPAAPPPAPPVPPPPAIDPDTPPPALAARKLLRLARIDDAMDGPGEWSLRPKTQVLIAATPRGQADDRYDMGAWWLAVPPGTRGAELLAARRRVWVIATFERFAPIDERRQVPAPVLRALEIHAAPTAR
jgi:hypothetical protein